jgi:hypothetical protein
VIRNRVLVGAHGSPTWSTGTTGEELPEDAA